MFTTEEHLALPPLPPEIPARVRVSLFLVSFLSHHNRLDGMMAFVGIWWGLWTLIFPEFWGSWPVTAELSRRMHGYPSSLSWILLLSGIINYASRRWGWIILRSCADLAAFTCWGLLTLVFLTVAPVFSPAVASYSAFAIAKLMAYINFQIGIDQRK